jgi:hypothetical protein
MADKINLISDLSEKGLNHGKKKVDSEMDRNALYGGGHYDLRRWSGGSQVGS